MLFDDRKRDRQANTCRKSLPVNRGHTGVDVANRSIATALTLTDPRGRCRQQPDRQIPSTDRFPVFSLLFAFGEII
jgi:hypothetical protein